MSRCRDGRVDAGRRDTGLVTKLCVYVSSKLCGQLCMHCVQSPVSSQQVSSSIFFISALDYQRTSTAAPQIVRRVVQPAEQLAVQPVVQSFSLRAICFASTRYAAFFYHRMDVCMHRSVQPFGFACASHVLKLSSISLLRKSHATNFP